MKKIKITNSSEVGKKCFDWAYKNYKSELTFIQDNHSKVDVLFSVFHNKVFKKDELKLFKKAYNFHGGSLPDYRGSSSPIWSIINGELNTALTVHELTDKIDSGEVYIVKNVIIEKHDTGESLYNKLSNVAYYVFKENFMKLINFKVLPMKKCSSKINKIYFRKDLEKRKNLTDLIRALHHSKKEKAYYINKAGQKIELSYE